MIIDKLYLRVSCGQSSKKYVTNMQRSNQLRQDKIQMTCVEQKQILGFLSLSHQQKAWFGPTQPRLPLV